MIKILSEYMLNSNKEWVEVNLGGSGSDEPPTIEVSDSGLITATAGSDTVTHQLSAEDNEDFVASNIKNGINIFGTTGTAQTAVVPEVGFVPTAWDNNGRITDGIWYGATVPNYAFYCYRTSSPSAICYLKHITLDSTVTGISGYAFQNLQSFSSITFSPNLTIIGDSAFDTCVQLSNVIFPNSLTTISQYAFRGSGLTKIVIPSSVTSINQSIFQNCKSLTSITFDSPNNLNLPQYLCDGCTALASVTFPSGISYVGYGAFRGCTNLTEVTFEGTPSQGIYNTAFQNCANLTIINVPWAEGTVDGAPWGATNATINYNYTPS